MRTYWHLLNSTPDVEFRQISLNFTNRRIRCIYCSGLHNNLFRGFVAYIVKDYTIIYLEDS